MKKLFGLFSIKVSPHIIRVLILLLVVLLGYGTYKFIFLKDEYSVRGERVATLEQSLSEIKVRLFRTEKALISSQSIVNSFQAQIESVSGTVGTLVKLSKTDKELLQKYSKVYFLNENYIPSNLVKIDPKYTYNGQEEYFHANTWPFLQNMLDASARYGISLQIISGFRSFETQVDLKSIYKTTYGSGANAFSADQGYSEHQLGTTVDLTTPKLGKEYSSFDKTDAFKWMTNNAYRYGFTLSYPKDNKYYVYEPWHWRFVGVALATRLHNDNKYYYDLDQREIDTYLVNIFD